MSIALKVMTIIEYIANKLYLYERVGNPNYSHHISRISRRNFYEPCFKGNIDYPVLYGYYLSAI